MQDALGRESGRLPHLIGICWLIAWFWLTRYPVVLCKQDNIAGKSGTACTPFGALFLCFSSSGCSDCLKKKKKGLPCLTGPQSLNRCPTFFSKMIAALESVKIQLSFFFFASTALTQSVMCLSLFEVQTFSLQALCEASVKNFKYAPLSWKKYSSLCLTFRRGKICRFWQQVSNKTQEAPLSIDLLQGQICCTTH